MNEDFKISINDVQDFLRSGGLKWDKTILTDEGKAQATRLKDLALKRNDPVAIPTIDRSGNPNIMNIAVNPISFITYRESFDYSDIDAVLEFVVENDFSEQFIKFLVKKYGKTYQDYAEKFCKREKSRLVLDTYEKVERLDAQKREILKTYEAELKKYNNVENLIYGNNSSTRLEKK